MCFPYLSFGYKPIYVLLTFLILKLHSTCWTPGLGWKGPVKYGLSFRLSFRLSISFLGIGSLVLSETQLDVRSPYIIVCDRARFFWKKTPSGKNDQKWLKMAQKHGF